MTMVLWLCHAVNHEHISVFCRIPLADIVLDLKLFLLLWHIYNANVLYILYCFCSVWDVVVPTVCMLVAHISVTISYVLLTTCAFGLSNQSL